MKFIKLAQVRRGEIEERWRDEQATYITTSKTPSEIVRERIQRMRVVNKPLHKVIQQSEIAVKMGESWVNLENVRSDTGTEISMPDGCRTPLPRTRSPSPGYQTPITNHRFTPTTPPPPHRRDQQNWLDTENLQQAPTPPQFYSPNTVASGDTSTVDSSTILECDFHWDAYEGGYLEHYSFPC